MGAIKLDQQITDYLPQLSSKQKSIVLGVVRKFAADQQDWWDELSPGKQAAIEEAIGQIKAGEGMSHAQVMKKYEKWRKK